MLPRKNPNMRPLKIYKYESVKICGHVDDERSEAGSVEFQVRKGCGET